MKRLRDQIIEIKPSKAIIQNFFKGMCTFHLRADPGNGPCQQKVLVEYINNNNNVYIPPAIVPKV